MFLKSLLSVAAFSVLTLNLFAGGSNSTKQIVTSADSVCEIPSPWVQAIDFIHQNDTSVLGVRHFPLMMDETAILVVTIPDAQIGTFSMYDMLGNEVLDQRMFFNQGHHLLEMDQQHLADGRYFYVLETASKKISGRLEKAVITGLESAQVSH